MTGNRVRTIELREYETEQFPRNDIPEFIIEVLQQKYKSQIEVTLHNSQGGDEWHFKAKGWVGYIAVTPEFAVKINPKVTIANLFGMLEYAYDLNSFRFQQGLIPCNTLEDFFDRLSSLLAQLIRDRTRKGLYRAYLPQTGQLGYVRGRLDTRHAIRKPWAVKLTCHYDEQTSDLEDNQILAWTLHCIARTGLCSDRTRPFILSAYRALHGWVTLRPFTAKDCCDRTYNRLNQDYQRLHALCRFFLENIGPTHDSGDASILPFLVDMAKLYERFVAAWLKVHLPSKYSVKAQERIQIGKDKSLYFNLDLVLYQRATRQAIYVLDTKYKTGSSVKTEDFHQASSYALSKNCKQAILIYPEPLTIPLDVTRPLDENNNYIRIRSLTFSLDGNLKEGGDLLLESLELP
jgi:5-methylcytosine-specific restriction enzyme subunit McrC